MANDSEPVPAYWTCTACGANLDVSGLDAGSLFTCPLCESEQALPAGGFPGKGGLPADDQNLTICVQCREPLDTSELSEGTEFECPHCGTGQAVQSRHAASRAETTPAETTDPSRTEPKSKQSSRQNKPSSNKAGMQIRKRSGRIPAGTSLPANLTSRPKKKAGPLRIFVLLLLLAAVAGGAYYGMRYAGKASTGGRPQPPGAALLPRADHMPESKDFSFGYWQNGWRKSESDKSPDNLCIESGHYGLILDMDKLSKIRFGRFEDDADYTTGLAAGNDRMRLLPSAELDITLRTGGRLYRAHTTRAGTETDTKRLQHTRLWESGRYVQHFDLQGLDFRDEAGNTLGCNATLDVVAWPRKFALTAELTPSIIYADGPTEGISGAGLCVVDKPLDIPHSPNLEHPMMTVECWVKIPEVLAGRQGWLLCKNRNEHQDGNYGFTYGRGTITAFMNIGGGRQNAHRITANTHSGKHKWHHLALTYDGREMRFFTDGKLMGASTIGRPRKPGNGLLRIGKRADGHGGIGSGVYDQIRIWNRALSGNEISRHKANPAKPSSNRGLTFAENFDHFNSRLEGPVSWQDAELGISIKRGTNAWQTARQIAGKWNAGRVERVTLVHHVLPDKIAADGVTIDMRTPSGERFPVQFDKQYNCLKAHVPRLKRTWAAGYTDIRNYDEFLLTVQNTGGRSGSVPFLLEFYSPAQITGMCPILCDEKGVPTGIPVQLSKNWHFGSSYLRAYVLLPASAGQGKYRLRIPYGFYGSVPAASHAQLSLVGWGGNGRWDQIAIGCWGETMCFDMDMSATEVAITDVRGLMLRNGRQGKSWGWTDAGWGGDWLCIRPGANSKLYFTGMKTAYRAHGPCLTEARYDGAYGPSRQVDVEAAVSTLRTDDYARTFQTLRYTFNRTLPAAGSWLFKMGAAKVEAPVVITGNRSGMITEYEVPKQPRTGSHLASNLALAGNGPWWIAFPGSRPNKEKDWGTGSRGLIIRGYRASFGGVVTENPSISIPAFFDRGSGKSGADVTIVPPEGVSEFKEGDSVELELEWITLPRVADDYYGPNKHFREHLGRNPESWKSVHREAVGNELEVTVAGGSLLRAYPIIVQARQQEVSVTVNGGVGYVPVRFEGLTSPEGYSLYESVNGSDMLLDQSVHGFDFWQTDYDPDSNTYRMTFNLPLDGRDTSTWILRRALPAAPPG